MLAASKLIGFVPTRDALKARAFYEDKLGFHFVSNDPFALVMKAGETAIRNRQGQGFHPGSTYRHGLGGLRYRSGGQVAHPTGRGI